MTRTYIYRVVNMIHEAEALYKELYLIEVSPMTFAELCDEPLIRYQALPIIEDQSTINYCGVKIRATWTNTQDGCLFGYMRPKA